MKHFRGNSTHFQYFTMTLIHLHGETQRHHVVFHHVNGFIVYPFLSERVQMEPNGPVMVNLV